MTAKRSADAFAGGGVEHLRAPGETGDLASDMLTEAQGYITCSEPLDLRLLLNKIPGKLWSRRPRPHGYVVFGLSPPASSAITKPTLVLPQTTLLLNEYLTRVLPNLKGILQWESR